MKIFVISLPEALARRESITRQMSALNLNFTFIDGVRVQEEQVLQSGYNKKLRLKKYGYELSKGEVGCFLAHKSAWKIVAKEVDRCLILEDDAVISGLSFDLLNLVGFSNYPIVRLAGIFEKKHKFIDDSQFAKYWGDPSGAAAYVLGPKEANCLLINSESFYMAVDDFMEARHIHQIKTYAYLPYPVKQAGTDSQIGDRGPRPNLTYIDRIRLMLTRITTDFSKYLHRIRYWYF